MECNRKHHLILLVTILFLMGGCGSGTTSDSYPSKPLTYFVPWAPGGMTDMTSRMMAAALQNEIGQPVNVVNRTGGGGVVGHLALAKAKADGYALGAVTVEITMLPHMGLTDLSYEDYHMLALQINNAAAVTVRKDAPWNDVPALLEYVKNHPGELQASGTARGGVWDLARIGMLSEANLEPQDMPWVPSQGSAPAMQELIAEGVDVVTASLSEVDAMRQSGLVKVLAVMSEERLSAFPDVPTLKEQGIDWSIGGWVAVGVPADTPPEVIANLESAISAAAQSKAYTDALEQAGSTIQFLTGEPLQTFVQNQHITNGKLLTKAGIAK